VEECDVYRPERAADLAAVISGAPQAGVLARGLGRSYGDAALNRGGAVVLQERLNRLLAFDADTGVLECEAGVSLAEILEIFLPRGYFFPVTPGTKFITIGGAIAADVHGKNHHRDGSMSAFVLDFRLLTATGDIVRCSQEENPDLFWATMGGMGLTGIVLDARIRLRRVETAYLDVDYEKVGDLDRALERFRDSDAGYAYTVAWIDQLARGRSLGRSVLMRANPAPREGLAPELRQSPLRVPRGRRLSVPFMLPNWTLNSLSMGLFNMAYYRTRRNGRAVTGYDDYFCPLDWIRSWNRIYGSRGVLQYQCVIPPEGSHQGLTRILEALSGARRPSFLAVLKSFGPESRGLLSFPRPGHTLSLDFPHTGPDLLEVLRRLDRIVLEHGGRIYLAKDACLDPEIFAQMYPGLDRFRSIKAEVDPGCRFTSSLARRLRIVEAA
jgi:FAD/FMN-containing dehydrogenase